MHKLLRRRSRQLDKPRSGNNNKIKRKKLNVEFINQL
jgi:hypothetical protein